MSRPEPKPAAAAAPGAKRQRWYHGITAPQWGVLLAASAGWIFDAYESQIFNITRDSLLVDILGLPAGDPRLKFWGDVYLGVFLVGGALGGTFFGSLADRIGRRKTMILTILTYSLFSGLTYFAQGPWQVAILRFCVALGTAGEWAVAATLVAEVFPARSRAQAGAIFHSTSNIGTWLAALVGLAVGTNWRLAYLTGILPALMVLWVRARTPESESWEQSQVKVDNQSRGSFTDLLSNRRWRNRAIMGMLLGSAGLGTYWGVTVAAQDLVKRFLLVHGVAEPEALAKAKFAYGVLVNVGGLVGTILFGPVAQWLGRRRAFAWWMLSGAIVVPVACYLPQNYGQLLLLMPLYGFCTYGFHAGFALYFPELFPTHLRGTGTGFCFNSARFLAAGILIFSGWLKSRPEIDLRLALTCLASLYLVGVVITFFLPETKGSTLDDP